jgi:predicted aspartyl protease
MLVWSFSLQMQGRFSFTVSSHAAMPPEVKGDWNRLEIPLKRSGNLLLIEAVVDSVRGDFILDTGAPYLVLNKTYFRNGISYGERTIVGADGVAQESAQRLVVKKLELSSAFYEEVDADVVSLAQLENARGIAILGLLGLNLFTDLRMEVDIDHNQLILHRLNAAGEMVEPLLDSVARTPDLLMKFRYCDNKVFLPVEVAGQKLIWMLDTGAESNVLDADVKQKVLDTFHARRRASLAGAGGTKQDVLFGTLEELKVGEQRFKLQQTMVASMRDLSETCSINVDGVLGYSFLQRGSFVLNFKTNTFEFYLYNWQ